MDGGEPIEEEELEEEEFPFLLGRVGDSLETLTISPHFALGLPLGLGLHGEWWLTEGHLQERIIRGLAW
jgi:hypothetical protein